MSQTPTTLEKFLQDAAAVLQEIQDNLAQLAQAALRQHDPLEQNGQVSHQPIPEEHLHRLSQHLLKLSEESGLLSKYLQNGTDVPPPHSEHWSQIRILQSQEEERAQLARELEDSVGQLLANTVFELASTRHLLSGGEHAVTDGLDALQAELEQGLADVRNFIADLEPATILSNFGLGGGLRRYLERYETRTGLATDLRINANIGRLPSTIEIAIFRIIQEALLNVHRHANASRVEVMVEERDEGLSFTVSDDGDGLAPEKIGASRRNLGLARMVDYADLLNGKLKILSEPGKGTHVILQIPYPEL